MEQTCKPIPVPSVSSLMSPPQSNQSNNVKKMHQRFSTEPGELGHFRSIDTTSVALCETMYDKPANKIMHQMKRADGMAGETSMTRDQQVSFLEPTSQHSENLDDETTCENAVSEGEASTDSADDDASNAQLYGPKNRSKRKPSKTQIKHIAPTNEDSTVKTKYGNHNIEDLFNDVTTGIFRGDHTKITSTQSDGKAFQDLAAPPPNKQIKKESQGSPETVRNHGSDKISPSYPCGICGKVFRVPSRYDSHMLGHSKGKPFCCNTCGKMFTSQEKLDHHIPVHNTDRKASFTCEMCNKVCVNWRAYLYHLKAKHTASGGKKFGCTICGRQFHTGQRLRNHMASHEIGKNHCCHICGKLFESLKKLDTHQLVHQLSSQHDQQLQCPDCGRQYTEWKAFKQHMKTHGAVGVQYPCGLCDEVFPTQYEKEKHKRVHKQVQCEFCEKYFRSASVLSIHLRIHTGERPYKCGLCERDFSQSAVLKVHMRTHRHEGIYQCKLCGNVYHDVMEYFKHHLSHLEEGNLQCEECGKIFENIANKNRHMAAHRDRAGRICQLCGKEFGRVSHLDAHMLCHADALSMLCKVCGKLFESEEGLKNHSATCHQSSEGESVDKTFPAETKGPLFCGLCGKMFRGPMFLKKHMKRHEREGVDARGSTNTYDEDVIEVENGEFVCIECGKAFGEKQHLNVHCRDHTGELPHTCILCGQSFKLRRMLLDHIAEHKRNGLMIYNNCQAPQPLKKKKLKKKKKQQQTVVSKKGSDTDTDHPHNSHSINVNSNHTAFEQYRLLEHVNASGTIHVSNAPIRDEGEYTTVTQDPYVHKVFGEFEDNINPSSKKYENMISSNSLSENVFNTRDVYERSYTIENCEKSYSDKQSHFHFYNPDGSTSDGKNEEGTKNLQVPFFIREDLYPYGVTKDSYGANSRLTNSLYPGKIHHGIPSLPRLNVGEAMLYHCNSTHQYSDNDRNCLPSSSPQPVQLKDYVEPTTVCAQRRDSHQSLDVNTNFSTYHKNSYLINGSDSINPSNLLDTNHQGSIPSSKFPSESSFAMSGFQLLPQTAFPDNSH